MTTTVNPAGLADFDHCELVTLPAYARASAALDDLAHEIRHADLPVTPEGWRRLVGEMATALPFSDQCQECRRVLDPGEAPIVAPFAVEIQECWSTGHHQCPRCGTTWTCGYSTNLPTVAALLEGTTP